ncbi:MAG TPA: orotidine-5'-phosphate decarboxylase [Syntrophomonadaceae bacterium]|nr:orotidine-5'-phosphate decarboxylase [Syntrophomonadaceae bacterium]HOQ08908.1 orotidine-5'-phosphate decarboxylase [Syntrophomonadaceae bacterium]HPU47719.1 orotidine-5'-phosphate decarboxylase [Syntrophomonadaceae bacterium]
MKPKERIILALDVDSEARALELVEKLADSVGAFKVGMQLYNQVGPGIVRQIQDLGGRVFVDLKFHDIPNTVAGAARVMTGLNCFMFNVHSSGGRDMMTAAMKAVQEESARLGCAPPLVLAVTVLTSISEQQLHDEMYISRSMEQTVMGWAQMAKECGLNGVVCSPQEIEPIRRACGSDFVIVTPGIRPLWSEKNDQKRITTPREALRLGADYMVIGRPITAAPDPREAALRIIEELEE